MYDRSNSTELRSQYKDYKDELSYNVSTFSAGKKEKGGSESVLARISDNYCL